MVGRGPITIDHMSKLPYIEACLRETLRLSPTAPVITLQPRADLNEEQIYLGGGKYEVKQGQAIVALLCQIHRDPSVYGDDANDFKPERMLDEPFSQLPKNSWKPFGNGIRACIGRAFAWQETILTTALLLQNFNFRFEDPSYELQIKQTLTIKPKDFFMHATLRHHHTDVVYLEKALYAGTPSQGTKETAAGKERRKIEPAVSSSGTTSKPMTILYGSNSGTCEALAQSLARVALGRGYRAQVDSLDSAVDKIPNDQPVVLISSSYVGQPPDNAAHFVTWLENLRGKTALQGVTYAVYGCGNHDWAATFHRIPKLLDSGFEENGATRVAKIGLGDVAAGDIFNDFDKWQDEQLWPAFGAGPGPDEDGAGCDFEIEVDTAARRTELRQDVKEAVVLSNVVLTAEGEPQKRHIVLKLPTGMNYKAGDYLAVLPLNDPKTVRRVLKWANLPWDAVLTIKSGTNTTLPTGRQISALDLFSAYVELSQPATRKVFYIDLLTFLWITY